MKSIKAKEKAIHELRLKKGLTLRALAEKANIAYITAFNLENKKTCPTPTTVKKVCQALDVSFDEIFEIGTKEGEQHDISKNENN